MAPTQLRVVDIVCQSRSLVFKTSEEDETVAREYMVNQRQVQKHSNEILRDLFSRLVDLPGSHYFVHPLFTTLLVQNPKTNLCACLFK